MRVMMRLSACGEDIMAQGARREVNRRLSNVYYDSTVGINNPQLHNSSTPQLHNSIYNLSGMQIDSLNRGINIVRNEDGTVSKMLGKK